MIAEIQAAIAQLDPTAQVVVFDENLGHDVPAKEIVAEQMVVKDPVTGELRYAIRITIR